MLHGHVDEVSRRAIQGWAADDANPGTALDVSIFINGRKIAQVACSRPRQDLRQTGQYGDGNHGFAFQFAQPLSDDEETHLSVRFSQTSGSLTRGDCIIAADGIRVIPPLLPLSPAEPVMMPGPQDPRRLLELLFWHDERLGLSPMLSRIEVDDYQPQQVHYAALGRMPERPLVLPPGRYYPRDHLQELLLSDAFQTDLVPLLARAYDDKRRLIFVHIPKCAGTDLTNKLKTRYPWVDVNIMESEWTSKHAMLRHLSRLAVQLRFNDQLYFCGHAGLDYYEQKQLVRPTDSVFTIVRPPADVVISQVNYILTRFWLDAEAGTVGPDTQGWLGAAGVDALPEKMTEEFALHAGMRLLQNTDIVRPNSVCFWLGGKDADAQTALNGLISQNVEVTDTARYGEWLARRWNIRSQSRDNSSMKFFALDSLPREYRDYIRDISVEDAKLHGIIDKAIARAGRPSVVGQELVRGLE